MPQSHAIFSRDSQSMAEKRKGGDKDRGRLRSRLSGSWSSKKDVVVVVFVIRSGPAFACKIGFLLLPVWACQKRRCSPSLVSLEYFLVVSRNRY